MSNGVIINGRIEKKKKKERLISAIVVYLSIDDFIPGLMIFLSISPNPFLDEIVTNLRYLESNTRWSITGRDYRSFLDCLKLLIRTDQCPFGEVASAFVPAGA